MARLVRVEFRGAVYHVTARGNERRRTFRDDADRRLFLTTLEEAVQVHGLRIHGYCLMPNHYHLLAETPLGNLSRGIGWLQTTYTIRFNRRYRRSGHLFQGRFKAHLVEADGYAMELLRYLHLNPVRPRDKSALVPVERRGFLAEYPWSSHRAFLGKVTAPAWLCLDWLSFFGRRRLEARGRYARFVEEAFGQQIQSPWGGLQAGLVLGREPFVEVIRRLLNRHEDRAQLPWTSRIEDNQTRQVAAQKIAQRQKRQAWRIWVRVMLGGESRIEVAREYGYKDGSAVTQAVKRLQHAAQKNPTIPAQMDQLKAEFAAEMSSQELTPSP